MIRVTRPGDPVTVGLTRLGQARVLEERPTVVLSNGKLAVDKLDSLQ